MDKFRRRKSYFVLILWLSPCFLAGAADSEPIEFHLPEGEGIGRDPFFRPFEYFIGPIDLTISDSAAIQSATLDLDLGPLLIADVLSAASPAEFDAYFVEMDDFVRITVNRIAPSASSSNEFLRINPRRDEIKSLGLGYGALRFLNVDVVAQDGNETDIITDNGSWFFQTDYFWGVPVQVVSSADQSPVQNALVSIVGADEFPTIFAGSIDPFGTDSDGRADLMFPAMLIQIPEDKEFKIFFHVSPPEMSPFKPQDIAVTLPAPDVYYWVFSLAVLELDPISLSPDWMLYR